MNLALHDPDGCRSELLAAWYAEGFYSNQTVPDALASGAEQFASRRLIFFDKGQTSSFQLGDLYRRSKEIAGALHGLGLRAGDTIGIQMPNRVEGYLLAQAALIGGFRLLPIIHIYGPSEVSYIMRTSGARALVVPDRWRNIDYLERLEALRDLPDLEFRIVVGEDVPKGAVSWKRLTELFTEEFPRPRQKSDDPALLLFTSGTTTSPKGALHSHNSLLAELKSDAGASGVNLSPWPAGHIAGVLSVLRLYFAGTESVLMDAWDANAAADLVEQFGVTGTSGTPFHALSLLDAAAQRGRNISSLRRYLIGAASVPADVVKRCDKAGIGMFRAYGSTEHPTITSGAPEDDFDKRSRTDGQLEPGCRVRIVDEEDKDLPVGSPGEILSQGPDQFLGYLSSEHNHEAFADGGWFRTGDIGRMDDDGFLTITDRKKDIIIRGGENIASKEVEDLLIRHAKIRDAAVVAVPHERLGEQVYAYLVPENGMRLSLEEVAAHFRELGVARQKTPEFIETVSELPRTPSGKVKKFELRARHERSNIALKP